MATTNATPDINEFTKAHKLLIESAPEGYAPHYLLLKKESKDPLDGFKWKEHPRTYEQALKHLKAGGNVGLLAHIKDPLVIVDRDDIVEAPRSKHTLTNTSRKRIGEHDFYFKDKGEEIPNIPLDTAGEIRAENYYVVFAGSFVKCTPEEIEAIPEKDRENAGKYTVKDPRPPANISFKELPKIFLDRFYEVEAEAQAREVDQSAFTPAKGKRSPLYDLTFKQVLPNVPEGVRVSHPCHTKEEGGPSTSEANFSFVGKLAHCWRHSHSLTVPQYLAVEAGLLTCMAAGNPHTNVKGSHSKLTGDNKIAKKVFDYAVEKGFIEKGAKPPGGRKEADLKIKLLGFCSKSGGVIRDKIKDIIPEEIIDEALKEELIKDDKGILTLTKIGKATKTSEKIQDLEFKLETGGQTGTVLLSRFTPRPHTHKILDLYKGRVFSEIGIGGKIGTIWGYNSDKGLWENIENKIKKTLRTKLFGIEELKGQYVDEVIRDIKELTSRERPQEPSWNYINIKNGVFNVITGDLEPHTPKLFFINQIPHEVDPKKKTCAEIDELFNQWVGEDKKKILYELISYTLIRAYPYQKLFFIHGKGNNGKRVYGALIKRLVGSHNVSAVSLHNILNRPFSVGHLFGKLVNISGEINVDKLEKTDLLKQLVGEDDFTADVKYQPSFEFVNYAKMLFSTNIIPITSDKTKGWYRRFYPIHFSNDFSGTEKRFIIDNLSEDEIQGLLYKCLFVYLPQIYEREFRFNHDPTTEELEKTYENLSNPIIEFIENNFESEGNGLIPRWIFRELFQRYLRKNGFNIWSDKQIGQEMGSLGYATTKPNYSEEEVKNWKKLVGKDEKDPISTRWVSYQGLSYGTTGQGRQGRQGSFIKSSSMENFSKHPGHPGHPGHGPILSQDSKIKAIFRYVLDNEDVTETNIQANLDLDPEEALVLINELRDRGRVSKKGDFLEANL